MKWYNFVGFGMLGVLMCIGLGMVAVGLYELHPLLLALVVFVGVGAVLATLE